MTQKSGSTPRIKIFLDGADRESMLQMLANPLIQGFTTNPSLMRKSGVKDYKGFCQDLLSQIRDKPISFEVFADDHEGMKRQAHEIAKWGSNVYVKIPVMTSQGVSMAPLIHELSHQGIKLNVTAVFTVAQSLEMAAALKGGAPSILSVFPGRIADCGQDPMPLMIASSEICKASGASIECLWASTREAYNIVQAEQAGCQIITAPLDIIKKVATFGKDPFALSLETVKTFKADSEAAGFQL